MRAFNDLNDCVPGTSLWPRHLLSLPSTAPLIFAPHCQITLFMMMKQLLNGSLLMMMFVFFYMLMVFSYGAPTLNPMCNPTHGFSYCVP